MKVKELIQKLSEEDPEMLVLVEGYESGFDNINVVQKKLVMENNNKNDQKINSWWEGDFEFNEYGNVAVIIRN